jgi:hypothetical protein
VLRDGAYQAVAAILTGAVVGEGCWRERWAGSWSLEVLNHGSSRCRACGASVYYYSGTQIANMLPRDQA